MIFQPVELARVSLYCGRSCTRREQGRLLFSRASIQLQQLLQGSLYLDQNVQNAVAYKKVICNSIPQRKCLFFIRSMKVNCGLASTGNFLLISLFVHTRKYAKHTNLNLISYSVLLVYSIHGLQIYILSRNRLLMCQIFLSSFKQLSNSLQNPRSSMNVIFLNFIQNCIFSTKRWLAFFIFTLPRACAKNYEAK